MPKPDKTAEEAAALAAEEAAMADAIDHPDRKPAEDPAPADPAPPPADDPDPADPPPADPKPEGTKPADEGTKQVTKQEPRPDSPAQPGVDPAPAPSPTSPAPTPELYPDFDEGEESEYDPALARALNAAKREIAALRAGSTQFSEPQLAQVKTIVGEAVKAALAEAKPPAAPAAPARPESRAPSRVLLARPDGARPAPLAPAPAERDPEADFAAEIDRKFFR